jgi:hypothetical protein
MANQLFFKPFKHKGSHEVYTYEDVNIANPIMIADTEYKAIWRSSPSKYPDLLLSLGTGLATEGASQLTDDPNRVKSIKPGKSSSSRGKTEQIVTYSVEERCEKNWEEYLNSLPMDAPADNFNRLTVKIPEPLPAFDDIESIDSFQNMARKYINLGEIRRIAARIFATFFYFEKSGVIEERSNKELFLKGQLEQTLDFAMV